MPGSWDPRVYRERAEQWRAEADKMALGKTRDAYLRWAEGFADMADFLEKDRADRSLHWKSTPHARTD